MGGGDWSRSGGLVTYLKVWCWSNGGGGPGVGGTVFSTVGEMRVVSLWLDAALL